MNGHVMRKTLVLGWVLSLVALSMATAIAGERQISRPGYIPQAEQQGEGSMIVVFEFGFGQGGGVWKDVIADWGRSAAVSLMRAPAWENPVDGKPKTISEDVQDLDAVIDAIAPGSRVLLVGHSYGGLLTTEFARLHPERLQGLVLVDPATMTQRHEAM